LLGCSRGGGGCFVIFSRLENQADRPCRKGVSFLSRFIGGGTKKKDEPEDEPEKEPDEEELRPEGMDAQAYLHSVDNIEFNPRHPQPPPYIKVRSKYKKEKEFDRVFLAQELRAGAPVVPLSRASTQPPISRTNTINSPVSDTSPTQSEEDAVWALEFSKDGKYLASGGQDKIIRVWAVISTPEERRELDKEEEEVNTTAQGLRLDAPVFHPVVHRQYEGHEGAVIDLSWSKNNFLLSASADKTVRLWHISRAECLCTFKHTEYVYSVQFHPKDDRFFLAGSRDMKLRLWSIPDKNVAFAKQVQEVITAVAFTPDGKTAIAGTVNGFCSFYETEGLKLKTQVAVRSNHGKNAKGSKICSIQAVTLPDSKHSGDVKLLISSNDSRIRVYNFRDKSLEMKFKGHKSEQCAIHATFSEDAKYIICGSEDKGAFIWSTTASENEKPNQRPVEWFEATTSKTMCALLAPHQTRQLLGQSEDPIYDLCNPPPVTLVSRSESVASSRPPTEGGSVKGTPRPEPPKKGRESPAYLARNGHPGGQIIVTASSTGDIRVYRQDCAFTKRKSSDDASSIFGGKKPSSLYMARAMSRSSTGRNGRSDSTSTQPPQDRILSWRQAISSTQSLDRTGARNGSDTKSTRSISPGKAALAFQGRRSDSIARKDMERLTPLTKKRTPSNSPPKEKEKADSKEVDENNPLWLQGQQSMMAWNFKEYAPHVAARRKGQQDSSHLGVPERPELAARGSKTSIVSTLSSEEMSADEVDVEESVDAAEVRCEKCRGTSFKAKTVKGTGHRLVCQRCGNIT
jgi:WD40 repeat protein